METNKIETLLKKYLEGETTLKEETLLKVYFSETENLPEEWKSYQQFFSFYQEAKNESYPIQKKKTKTLLQPILLVAASLAIIFTMQLSGFFNSSNSYDQIEAENVFKEFQVQMKSVSSHLNNGSQNLAYLAYWNTTAEKLIK